MRLARVLVRPQQSSAVLTEAVERSSSLATLVSVPETVDMQGQYLFMMVNFFGDGAEWLPLLLFPSEPQNSEHQTYLT